MPGEYRISVEQQSMTRSDMPLPHQPAKKLSVAAKSVRYHGIGKDDQRWICLKGHEDMYMFFGIAPFYPADRLPHLYSRVHQFIVPEQRGMIHFLIQ